MTPVRHYCLYFDSVFLPRGLALYESLRRHAPASRFWMLCLDHPSREALVRMDLPSVRLITLAELEENDAPLKAARGNRSLLEYYLTCTPALPLFILNRHPEVDAVTYLDSDLFFFADPEPIFAEIEANPIAITPHRYSEESWDDWARAGDRRPQMRAEKSGVYNDGWVSFKRDPRALACLQWWRERCIDWCYNRFENGRFTEQKYLDEWPARFPGTHSISHKGANVGPWNVENHEFRAEKGRICVDEQPLVFFHFSGLKQIRPWLYFLNLRKAGPRKVHPAHFLLRHVYAPYIRALTAAADASRPYLPQITLSTKGRIEHQSFAPQSRIDMARKALWHLSNEYYGLRMGDHFIF